MLEWCSRIKDMRGENYSLYLYYIYIYNDNEKTFRLIKECDLQLYEGGPLSFSSESQTAETSFEY